MRESDRDPIRVFVGYDAREQVGLGVFASSVWRRASLPVSITPINESNTGIASDGSNAFTLSRFVVPRLCHYSGWAIWAESDMVCLHDIADLWSLREANGTAVQVVKHDYVTRFDRKYPYWAPQSNEQYERKNWSSLMLIYAGHFAWRRAPLDDARALHRFSWLSEEEIGELPRTWNWLVGEDMGEPPPHGVGIAHFTIGLPGLWLYEDVDSLTWCDIWKQERKASISHALPAEQWRK